LKPAAPGVPKRSALGHGFERFAHAISHFAGSTTAFIGAVGLIVLWVVTGSLFHYSNTWQLVINTGTTIVTFLMVFLIQRAQNNDARAIHLKLNEVVAAVHGASNRLINVEDLTEDEVRLLHRYYSHLVRLARETGELTKSHSIEEAGARHALKVERSQDGRAS